MKQTKQLYSDAKCQFIACTALCIFCNDKHEFIMEGCYVSSPFTNIIHRGGFVFVNDIISFCCFVDVYNRINVLERMMCGFIHINLSLSLFFFSLFICHITVNSKKKLNHTQTLIHGGRFTPTNSYTHITGIPLCTDANEPARKFPTPYLLPIPSYLTFWLFKIYRFR